MLTNLLDRGDTSSRSMYINYPAIAFFTISAVVVAGCVHGIYLWQVARHTPMVLAEAKRRVADGDEHSALAYYQTYLGYRPDDKEAVIDHALLKAKAAQSADDAADAFYTLLQALPNEPGRNDIRKALVELGLKLGRLRDCPTEIDELLKQQPDDLDVLLLAARGAEQLGQHDVARERYEKLLSLGDNRPEVYLELLRVLSDVLKDTPASEALLTRLLAEHPTSKEVRLIAGIYYFQRGQLGLSDQHLGVAVNELQVTDPQIYRLRAEIAQRRNRPLEFATRLAQVASASPPNVEIEFQLAEVDLSLGKRQVAKDRLLKIAQDERSTPEVLWRVITLLMRAESTEELPELKSRLQKIDKAGTYLKSLELPQQLATQQWQAALELSEELLKATDVSAIFATTVSMWRADCFGHLGNVPEQVNSYRRAIESMNNYTPARLQLARLYFRIGNFKGAQGEFATLIQQSPLFAREFVTELLAAQSPGAPKLMSASDLERIFGRWQRGSPDDPTPLLCQLDLYRRKQDRRKVTELIAEGIRKWPQQSEFRTAQIDQLLAVENWDAAWKALQDAEQHIELQPELLARRVAILEHRHPDNLAELLTSCAQQFRQLDRDGQAQVWPILVRALHRAGVDTQSVESVLQGPEQQQTSLVVGDLVKLQKSLAAGNLEESRQHLESLRTSLGEDSNTFRLAATLYDVRAASQGDQAALARANQTLETMRRSSSPLPIPWMSLAAELDLVQQRPLDAIAGLQAVIRAGDARTETLVQTLTLMVAAGQLDQVVPFLKKLGPSSVENSGTEAVEAPIAARPRDLPLLRSLLEASAAKSWPLALALSRVDLELKQPERAAAMIQTAIQLAPTNSLIWANHLAYVARYQPDQISAAIAAAESKLSVEDRAKVLPSILVSLNRRDEAAKILAKASQLAPTDPEVFRAHVRLLRQTSPAESVTKTLQQAIAREEAEYAGVRKTAQQELVRLKTESRDYRQYREALDEAANLVQSAPDDDESLVLQAEVLSSHSAHWNEAITLWEKLLDSPKKTVKVEALVHLARIYEQRREWKLQGEKLNAMRPLASDFAGLLVQLMRNAVAQRDQSLVDQLYHELVTSTQDSRYLLQGDVLRASLQSDHADVLTKIQSARDANQVPWETALEWYALLKADAELEALLKVQTQAKRADAMAKYVMFLGARQRMPEALSLLSQVWKAGARDSAALLASAMCQSPAVTPQDLSSIRSSILKLIESPDPGEKFLAAAATLEDHAGRYAETQSIYRRILEKSPDHVFALNNLAFLEALSEQTSPSEEVLARIRRALDVAGPNDQLIDTEGMVLFKQGQFREALARFQQAWNMRPEATYLGHRAWALTALGQYAEAAAAFRQLDALESPPKYHQLERELEESARKTIAEKGPK